MLPHQVLAALSALTMASGWQHGHRFDLIPSYYGNYVAGSAVIPVARGSATFLPGPPPPPPPAPIVVSLAPAPYLHVSRYAASPLPIDRTYSTSGRGRPAIIPTPYAKYSSSFSKNVAPAHPNALTSPEPGFYGFQQRYPLDDNRVVAGVSYKSAVGFYGKAL